jgi:hypothetical protein
LLIVLHGRSVHCMGHLWLILRLCTPSVPPSARIYTSKRVTKTQHRRFVIDVPVYTGMSFTLPPRPRLHTGRHLHNSPLGYASSLSNDPRLPREKSRLDEGEEEPEADD